MDSLSSVSPSFVLPSRNPLSSRRRRITLSFGDLRYPLPRVRALFGPRSTKLREVSCGVGGAGVNKGDTDAEDGSEDVDMEMALSLDGNIPGTSNEFVKRVSSRAYDMRRHLHQTFDSSSYDVLEANPWRESSKPVYVLTHNENQICTMKTRRNRSEVERELGLLFSKGGKWRPENQKKQSKTGIKFQMLVEDIREGVLVFEDENEAARYCDLLQGGGKGCEGVFEIEASSVFDLCKKMRALAVLFRRGRTPPLPQSLELNLKARKRSLEDQDELV
ncbi:uncharacterized protein LOC120079316 [Benincasa hispida]|uniref:uncharacterized protein LOC120079316 n=1 Tax=Benincasa hispida TaxID=102211 RepID=UPI00190073B8|nr:uncharacterized protein LOC120079316 [Benincasa hispida]